MPQSELEKELEEIEEEVMVDSLDSRFNAFRRDFANQALSVRILLSMLLVASIVIIVLLARSIHWLKLLYFS